MNWQRNIPYQLNGNWKFITLLTIFGLLSLPDSAFSQAVTIPEPDPEPEIIPNETRDPYKLVEEFTAYTLAPSEIKIGTEFEYGMTSNYQIGADLVTASFGIPSIQTKWRFLETGRDMIALGARFTYLSLSNLAIWTPARNYFSELDAKIFRPAIHWTNKLSPRLNLHTYWTFGIGKVTAKLSEEGKRKVWQDKHPGGDYVNRNEGNETDNLDEKEAETTNLEKNTEDSTSNLARRSLELQSFFGLSTDRFQITGEFARENKNKVLVTTRIEQMKIEELSANSIRFTVAQHWVADPFQFRVGIGVLYLAINGKDLDNEPVDEYGVTPVSDMTFYWRF